MNDISTLRSEINALKDEIVLLREELKKNKDKKDKKEKEEQNTVVYYNLKVRNSFDEEYEDKGNFKSLRAVADQLGINNSSVRRIYSKESKKHRGLIEITDVVYQYE